MTPLKLSVAEQIALAGCFVALLMSGLSFASEPAQLVAPAPFHQLLVEASVRAAGMGGCSATLLDVPASVLDHPGGAALAHWRTNVSTSYVALVPNADGEFQHRRVSALVRLSDNWSVGGAFVDFPITTLHYSEPEDSSGYDVHHSADVGERLAGFALATRLGDIGLGASATWLSEDLGSDNEHDLVFTGWRWAIGAHYRHALRSRGAVSVAASVRNLGPKLGSDLDWELEAPAIASIGSSAELQEWIPVPALLAVQYDRWLWPISGRGGCEAWRFGLEFAPGYEAEGNRVWRLGPAARLGYVAGDGCVPGGWTYGLSLEQSSVVVEVASLPSLLGGNAERPWQIGVRVLWGGDE